MFKRIALVLLALGVLPVVAQALTITTSGTSGGYAVSASADFTLIGSDLQIVLTNTSDVDTRNNAGELTALLFSLDGAAPTLSMNSASGTTVVYSEGPTHVYTLIRSLTDVDLRASAVDGAWTFAGLGPSAYGLSTTGGSVFDGGLVDGPDYGIVAVTGDIVYGNRDGLSEKPPRVDTSATFVISGWGGLIPEDYITDVTFWWGTGPDAVTEGGGGPSGYIPEPTTVTLLGIGLCGLLLRRRRKH
jgi:hypothetical protein